MITKITYYEVGDAYDAEGRGPFRVIATFSTESIADQYAADKGNYGNDAKVREVTAFVCDSFEDVEEHNERVKLNNALGKLNKEEIDLLRKHFDQDVK